MFAVQDCQGANVGQAALRSFDDGVMSWRPRHGPSGELRHMGCLEKERRAWTEW